MKMKTERAVRREREIMDCMLEMVMENGLGGLTTKKIAARVGFSEAALFRYFPSKKALILGLMDRLKVLLIEPIESIAMGRENPDEKLLAIVRHHAALIRRYNSLPVLLFAEASASGDPELIGRIESIFHRYRGLLERIIDEGKDSGEFTHAVDSDCLALMFLGLSSGLAIGHRLSIPPDLERRFVDKLAPFLVSRINATEEKNENG